MEPAPTELQHAFVSASSTNRYRRKQFLAATGLVVVFLILAGAVGAIILGIKARQVQGLTVLAVDSVVETMTKTNFHPM